jgi:hypothetical protein
MWVLRLKELLSNQKRKAATRQKEIEIYSNGDTYVGEWKDGKRHGQGTYTWACGNKYVGRWVYNKQHGQGIYTWFDGEKYVGAFKDDLYHGEGTHTSASGVVFKGKWKDGKRHEQVPKRKAATRQKKIHIYANGDKYEGEWKDGKRHGQGTFRYITPRKGFPELNYLTGQIIQKDLRNKYDRNKYVGGWQDDKRHGHGTYTSADGHKYVGGWKDDKKNGQGTYTQGTTYTFADGDEYVGGWKDDKKNGQGTYTWREMSAHEKLLSFGRDKNDRIKYEGEWKDDKKNGQGRLLYRNGDEYVGDWQDDKRHGHGTYTSADGAVYRGGYKDDKKHIILKRKPYVAGNKFPRKDAIPSSHSRYYIPKKHTNGIYDVISKELLSFKDGNKKSIEFWKSIVKQEFENKSYDYVVRVLSSNELKASGRKPLDAIGETIASLTGAIYDKSVLSKSRITEELKYMNKQERIAEISDVYQVSSRLDFSSKRVLIIDDVTTTGTTIKAVAKALKQRTQSIKLHSYCLCKTSDDMNANADFIK